ncbi:cyclopropane-fatty-acyl-phospholipid synthase domain protein [Burkholderia pseudomallei]|nr:cyclopropane-fatty-acyl-phospholipid synthase domain protein [Burkholderia pseudomallei]
MTRGRAAFPHAGRPPENFAVFRFNEQKGIPNVLGKETGTVGERGTGEGGHTGAPRSVERTATRFRHVRGAAGDAEGQ